MLLLLLRVVNRFRPREGWPLALLGLVALLCAPAAALVMDPRLGGGGLFTLTLLAAILGLRLARSRLAAWAASLLAVLLGGGLAVAIVGQIVPPLSLLWTEMLNAGRWLSQVPQGSAGRPLPFAQAAAYVWQRLADLGVRLWWWGQAATTGGTARDPIALALLVSCLAWVVAFFAAWQIYRRRSALLGLTPSGVALATVSFFGGGLTLFYLIVYLFCALILVAGWHLWLQQDRWQKTGIDYPGDLGQELILNLAPLLVLVLTLAAIFPVVGPRQVADAFWQVMDRPWSAVERASERLFGPLDHAGGGGRGGRSGGTGGTLPRSHLLGAGPDLSKTIVLYVTTNDPPPPRSEEEPVPPESLPPRRYWRSTTYDTYTGQGWSNGPLEERSSSPDQPLDATLPPGPDLVQQFDLLLPEAGAVYAANGLWQIDHAVQTWWRWPGDLAQVTGAASQYVAVSRPPAPSVAELRQAPISLPPEIAERYLSLPETLPPRVRDLALAVAGDQATRYDQALALETYLRAYTYTLDLPQPPGDRDLVDYFLFDLQQGYCDYYASAMVVMARSLGIPARLATGYAQGTYDYDRQHWVVTEKDSHTWVEIYFDGIGWVEFEPTASQPALSRRGGEGLPRPAVPPLPPRPHRWWQQVPWPLGALGLVLVLSTLVVFWLWRPRQQRGLAARDLARDRYARLLLWGTRLRHPPRASETPSEYGASLGQALHTRGQRARLSPVRRAGAEAPLEVERLTDSFVRAQYDAKPLSDREGWQIRDLWLRLRRRLWWLWLGRRS